MENAGRNIHDANLFKHHTCCAELFGADGQIRGTDQWTGVDFFW